MPSVDRIFDGLGEQLKANGCKVKKVKGWQSRGSGTFDPRGVVFHHTATPATSGNAPALGIVTHGRSDLPGPLCQFLVARDGTIFFVAKGRANHAGLGGPYNGIPKDSGNAYTFGIECENSGVGEPWSKAQKRAIAVLCACLLRRMNAEPKMLFGHKEWTTRKIDPAGIDMDNFRDRVEHVELKKAA